MNIFGIILQKVGIVKPIATPASAVSPQPATSAPAKPVTSVAGTSQAGAAINVPAKPESVTNTTPVVHAPVKPIRPISDELQDEVVARHPKPLVSQAPVPEQGPEIASLRPVAVSIVDVVSQLDAQAAKHRGLDWKVSIVDLLKLLELDSGLSAREDLAKELGCPDSVMSDNVRMNTWLHKTVLQKIAENGGNIPAYLLD